MTLEIRNDGRLPVKVLEVGRSGPGIELLSATGTYPTTLEPGSSVRITLTYAFTDCDAIPTGDWPIPVRVQRVWGTQTAYVQASTPFATWQETIYEFQCETPS